MDSNLTYEPHIDHVVKRCNGILIGLLHARHILPRKILPLLVDTLVLSHLRYCCTVYGNSASATSLKRLQKVMNFAARVVSGRRKFQHISDVLTELGWMSVQQLVSYSTLCATHKILVTGEPECIRAALLLNRDVTTRVTRQADHLHVSRARTEWGKGTFIYRACELFNEFASDIVHVPVGRFKSEVKRRCTM